METSQPAPGGGPTPAQPYGEVFDRGYQHYTGPRAGRSHAIQALLWYSFKSGLGIKKKWTAKLIPLGLYAIAFIPAIVLVGVLTFVPAGTNLSYYFLNEFIRFALLVMAAAGAAEMLCDDRRENVLALYFSRTITRADYLLAKIGALIALLATIAFGPPLILFLGKTLLAGNPVSYFFRNLGDLGRIFVFGLLASAFYAAIGLSIAAYTNRKGIASAIFIGGVFIISGLAEALFQALDTGARKYLLLLSPNSLVSAFSRELFNAARPNDISTVGAVSLPLVVMIGAMLAVVLVSAFVMYARYLADE